VFETQYFLRNSTMWDTVLCCKTRYYVVRHSTMLWDTVLCCETQYYVVRHSTMLWDTVLCCETWYYVVRHSTLLWDTVLCCETQYYVMRHSTMLWDTELCETLPGGMYLASGRSPVTAASATFYNMKSVSKISTLQVSPRVKSFQRIHKINRRDS